MAMDQVGYVSRLQLRSLPLLARVGVTFLVLVLIMGMGASAMQLLFHDANRDESKEFTVDDIRAVYHGLDRAPVMRTALEKGHPETLKPEQREVLLKWVKSGRITEDYDSIDLGVASPSEIIASSCVSCHGPSSKDAAAAAVKLSSMEGIKKVAFGKKVNPADVKIVTASMHAHAPSLGMLGLVLAGLLWLTRLPRGLAGGMVALMGIGLAADFACWWWARSFEPAVWGIVIGGGVANAMMGLAAAVVVVDAWWPRGRE